MVGARQAGNTFATQNGLISRLSRPFAALTGETTRENAARFG